MMLYEFWGWVSLCGHGSPGTCFVDQPGFELREILPLPSGIKDLCHHHPAIVRYHFCDCLAQLYELQQGKRNVCFHFQSLAQSLAPRSQLAEGSLDLRGRVDAQREWSFDFSPQHPKPIEVWSVFFRIWGEYGWKVTCSPLQKYKMFSQPLCVPFHTREGHLVTW